jgi:DNA-binding YbaB/EbfC family protein
MNIAKMMKQAQQMQAKVQQIQEDLAKRTYEATAGGGAVKAVATGDGELQSLTISPDLIKDAANDADLLQDLVVTAIREASAKAKADAAAELGKATSGLGLPGF